MITLEPIAKPSAATADVARRMRAEDVAELWELGRMRPDAAVIMSVEASTEAYIAVDPKGTPIAVLGATSAALGDVAVPWLLGTREIDGHAAEYLRLGRAFAKHLLRTNALLENVALAKNRRSLTFLKRMGFAIHKPHVTPSGSLAARFTMRR